MKGDVEVKDSNYTWKIDGSLAMETKREPTKASPAPVVSTVLTEKPLTFPLKLCAS